jgi:hypothetical protein
MMEGALLTTTHIDIIVVNTAVPCTMPELDENTQCVITTTGPYTFYGILVIKFWVKYRTHYVEKTSSGMGMKTYLCQWSLMPSSVTKKWRAPKFTVNGTKNDHFPFGAYPKKMFNKYNLYFIEIIFLVCFSY